ncbi:MAG: hypothetical protein HDR19_09300 [Lachnospiraceae bacterium]|nr:hypothetical protein [Lachnospiraceae bacterium]
MSGNNGRFSFGKLINKTKEGVIILENIYSKVKVDNEIDFCSVTDIAVKEAIEKAFMKARVSYFLRWEKPGFFSQLFSSRKPDIVFCINSAQVEIAEEALQGLGDTESSIKMLKLKSNNRLGF